MSIAAAEEIPGGVDERPALSAVIEHFRSENLVVREVGGFSRDVLIVTFDSYTNVGTLDRPGFGEAFLHGRRVDAVHVISRDNRWYQYPEMPEAAEIVRRLAARYKRTMTYGTSMGGYAAIRYGGAVGASVALAISPQFSVDPAAVPFEKRWLEDARTIDFSLEREWPSAFVETAYIVYDPCNPDKQHAQMFGRATRVIPVEVRNSGHPSVGVLAETGLLQTLPIDVATGAFDETAFLAAFRERRRQSAWFFLALADRCRNPQRRIRLLRRANELAPGNPAMLMRYGLALAAGGRIAEARTVCEDALARNPDDPVRLCEYSEFLIRIAHWERAEEVMDELVRRWPSSPAYDSRLATLRSLLASERFRPSPFPSGGASFASRWMSRAWRVLPPRDVRLGRRRHPPELRVTTVPAPPPFAHSWSRHLDLLRALPAAPFDLLLVGDSLVHYWPEECWGTIRHFNFGIAADKTQHALWRLHQFYPGQLRVERALVMLGTNNLGADDGPEAICAGVAAVVARLRRIAPGVRCWVVEIPPCGPEFGFRSADRLRTNELLRSAGSFRSINVDAVITTGFASDCRNYLSDQIHFSEEGYRVLTRYVLSEMS